MLDMYHCVASCVRSGLLIKILSFKANLDEFVNLGSEKREPHGQEPVASCGGG
jgi:hypothetical protein